MLGTPGSGRRRGIPHQSVQCPNFQPPKLTLAVIEHTIRWRLSVFVEGMSVLTRDVGIIVERVCFLGLGLRVVD